MHWLLCEEYWEALDWEGIPLGMVAMLSVGNGLLVDFPPSAFCCRVGTSWFLATFSVPSCEGTYYQTSLLPIREGGGCHTISLHSRACYPTPRCILFLSLSGGCMTYLWVFSGWRVVKPWRSLFYKKKTGKYSGEPLSSSCCWRMFSKSNIVLQSWNPQDVYILGILALQDYLLSSTRCIYYISKIYLLKVPAGLNGFAGVC